MNKVSERLPIAESPCIFFSDAILVIYLCFVYKLTNYGGNTIMIIRTHKDLNVFQLAFKSSMEIFEITKRFPKDERFALTSQIRRSSRAVCANLAEAFRKRKYPKSFVAKICDSEGEAAETQTWLDFSLECNYIDEITHQKLIQQYENILGKLVKMASKPDQWVY